MHPTADGTLVVREVRIAARPETIWEFLTDPAKLVRWMGVTASIDPRPGGGYLVEVLPGNVASGAFVEVERPRRLVHTWGWESGTSSPVPPGATLVEFDLVPEEGGTLLRLTHRRLPDAAAASSHAQGWEHYLPRLSSASAGRDPGLDPWLDGGRP